MLAARQLSDAASNLNGSHDGFQLFICSRKRRVITTSREAYFDYTIVSLAPGLTPEKLLQMLNGNDAYWNETECYFGEVMGNIRGVAKD